MNGFSLPEILAMVGIIGVLAVLAVPRFLFPRAMAEQETCEANRVAIAVQVEAYHHANNTYPTWTALSDNTDHFPQGAPTCPAGGIYSIDEGSGVVSCSVH